jgi:hypothetical protein
MSDEEYMSDIDDYSDDDNVMMDDDEEGVSFMALPLCGLTESTSNLRYQQLG